MVIKYDLYAGEFPRENFRNGNQGDGGMGGGAQIFWLTSMAMDIAHLILYIAFNKIFWRGFREKYAPSPTLYCVQ